MYTHGSKAVQVTATEFPDAVRTQKEAGKLSALSTFQTLEQDQPNSVHDELYDELYDGFHLLPGKL